MNTTTAAHIDRSERNVGIDIGKSTLDVYIYELDVYLQYPNTTEGIRELIKKLSRYNLTRILVEATGGYERGLVEACAERELPVIIVQPTRVSKIFLRRTSDTTHSTRGPIMAHARKKLYFSLR